MYGEIKNIYIEAFYYCGVMVQIFIIFYSGFLLWGFYHGFCMNIYLDNIFVLYLIF